MNRRGFLTLFAAAAAASQLPLHLIEEAPLPRVVVPPRYTVKYGVKEFDFGSQLGVYASVLVDERHYRRAICIRREVWEQFSQEQRDEVYDFVARRLLEFANVSPVQLGSAHAEPHLCINSCRSHLVTEPLSS